MNKPIHPIHYIQTTYGEVLFGRFDKATNTLHNAMTIMSQQSPQGLQVGILPTGSPLLADPMKKEFHTIEIGANAVAYSINLEEAKTAQAKELVTAYKNAISPIMQPGQAPAFQL